ncbi:MAG: arginase [bacterium]
MKTTTIEMIGMPLDLGAGRRGVDMGPSAMRIACMTEKLLKLGYEIIDDGDIRIDVPEVLVVENSKLKYLKEIVSAVSQLAKIVQSTIGKQNFPLVLGGDHSIAIGTIGGVAAALKKQNKKPGVVWIDAHGDMNTHETTPSGNIHGMPFAAVLGKGVEALTSIGGKFQKVEPQNAVLVGARCLDSREQKLIRESGVTVYTMEDIDRRGIFDVMIEAVEVATSYTAGLHLGLDMDALDPQIAPGVGTPVRGGLTYREAHTAMEIIARSGKLCSMEIVEVNPILDDRNTTAEVAVELALSALGKRII